jgi:dihydroorotase
MKNLPFGEAEPGATGLELLLSLALRWGADVGLALPATLARVTCDPVRVLGDAIGPLAGSAGRIVEGGVADLCLFDPAEDWAVTPGRLVSQGKHTPFSFATTGMRLPGRVRATLVAGTLAYEGGLAGPPGAA